MFICLEKTVTRHPISTEFLAALKQLSKLFVETSLVCFFLPFMLKPYFIQWLYPSLKFLSMMNCNLFFWSVQKSAMMYDVRRGFSSEHFYTKSAIPNGFSAVAKSNLCNIKVPISFCLNRDMNFSSKCSTERSAGGKQKHIVVRY